ncbi:hypothetical protein [Planococcus sp. CPCC 101016]|nr:hypothetical protein [Planococcus sp. CPCC 101016]
MLDKWLSRLLARSISCHFASVKCLGPNLLVKKCLLSEHKLY